MPDATDRALQAAVKALAEVVSPAVDAADPLAVDQLRLAVSWLQFHGLRRADERRLAWATLRQRLAQGRDVLALLDAAAPPGLAARCASAELLLERTDLPASAWRDAAVALDTCVGEAVDTLAGGPAPLRDALGACVLEHAHDSLLLQRAWFAPLGFEARPDVVPPLATLLEGAPAG